MKTSVDDDKAGVLERLGENIRVHVGIYSTTACSADHIYSNFPRLAIIDPICFCMYKEICTGQICVGKCLLWKKY